jgi:hypothetical protein
MNKSGESLKREVDPGLQDHRHSLRPGPDAPKILPEASRAFPVDHPLIVDLISE